MSNEIDDETCMRIADALSRMEEVNTSARDQWGGWDWQYSDAQRRGELYVPWLDRVLAELGKQIQLRKPDRRRVPLWPDNKRFAVCLTHDVDDVMADTRLSALFHTIRNDCRANLSPRLKIGRATGRMRGWLSRTRRERDNQVRTFEDWLKLESSFGFRSTFYFFPSNLRNRHSYDCAYQFHDMVKHGESSMTVADMMRGLDRAGWEIGLHGSYQSAVEPGLLRAEREQLESIIGHPIISTRQHWLHYDVRMTPRLHAEAGFTVDSTQGFNRSIGFRAGTSFPYWCWDHQANRPLPVLEVPQHIMDGGLFTANALEYDEDLAIRHSLQLMDAVEGVGGCLTLSWHAQLVNDDKYWTVYKALLQEAARRGAWGCSVGEMYEWWTRREQRLMEETPKNDFHAKMYHHGPASISS
jgi:hypothetical protein